MNLPTILQTSANVIRKSAEMAAEDPHGIIITVISVFVVFASLAILYCAYRLIGRICNSGVVMDMISETPAESVGKQEETEAAIGLALHLYLSENAHDNESYIITIKRK